MKTIKNLEELKYRKLYIRTEIFRKEQNIKRQFGQLKSELNAPGFKNEIARGILDNPSVVINVARITYKLVKGWKKRKNRKKKQA
jgi:hypothetical protein